MNPHRPIHALMLGAATWLLANTAFATNITSTFTNYDDFDCGTATAVASECWGKVGDSGTSLTWVPTGGGDGFLQMDEAGTGQWDWFVSPTKFLGDQGAFFGGTLSFDIHPSAVTGTRGVSDVAAVVLHSTALTIGFFLDAQPLANTWTSISVLLTSDVNWVTGTPASNNAFPLGSKQAATDAEILSVLSDLTDLWILGDWGTSRQTIGLDNVVLAQTDAVPVPAPGPAGLLGVALLAVLMRRRRSNGR